MAIVFLLIWLACAGLGCYVAVQKGRSQAEGLILGFLLGPLGILIVALLPAGSQARPKARRTGGRSRSLSAGTPEYRADWDAQPAPPKADAVEDEVLSFLNGTAKPRRN